MEVEQAETCVANHIVKTTEFLPNTEIPATFQLKLGDKTLWADANATEHIREYVGRFGAESWSIKIRSDVMLKSFYSGVDEAMSQWGGLAAGRYEGVVEG